MKPYVLCFVSLFFSISIQAQIDTRKKTVAIPAIDAKKDSTDVSPLTPSKPIENNIDNNNTFGTNKPKVSPILDMPKKEFSMFSEEEFGNPGELYIKQVNKNLEDVKLSKKELELRNGSTVDQNFGDFRVKGKSANIVYRDHGYTDGDVIQVRVNDDIIYPRVLLTQGFKGFKLELQPGINKIDFLALNQGESGPNTAEFKVTDEAGNVIAHNQWNLATGVKATIVVVKE